MCAELGKERLQITPFFTLTENPSLWFSTDSLPPPIFWPCSPQREGAGGGGIQVAAFVLRPLGGPENLQTSFFNRPPKQPLDI